VTRGRKRRQFGNDETHWYALRVVPQKEYIVAHLLERGEAWVYVPTKAHFRRRTRYSESGAEYAGPEMPGCIFVRFATAPAWYNVLRNHLILGPIGRNGAPWRFDAGELFSYFARKPLSAPTAEDYAHSRLIAYAAYQWPGYRDAEHHRLIARKLEEVERGDIDRLMIFMPPRHGKSMLASEFFPAWYLGRNPGHYVVAATYAQELADDFGRKVRNQIMGEEFGAVFPGVTLKGDSPPLSASTSRDRPRPSPRRRPAPTSRSASAGRSPAAARICCSSTTRSRTARKPIPR
jgi:hypothetical protein